MATSMAPFMAPLMQAWRTREAVLGYASSALVFRIRAGSGRRIIMLGYQLSCENRLAALIIKRRLYKCRRGGSGAREASINRA